METSMLKGVVATEKGVRFAMEHTPTGEKVYTFIVSKEATKPKLKKMIEEIYGVEVKSVNTLISHGKTKFFKGRKGKRQDLKKAYVSLKSGEIDIKESM